MMVPWEEWGRAPCGVTKNLIDTQEAEGRPPTPALKGDKIQTQALPGGSLLSLFPYLKLLFQNKPHGLV